MTVTLREEKAAGLLRRAYYLEYTVNLLELDMLLWEVEFEEDGVFFEEEEETTNE